MQYISWKNSSARLSLPGQGFSPNLRPKQTLPTRKGDRSTQDVICTLNKRYCAERNRSKKKTLRETKFHPNQKTRKPLKCYRSKRSVLHTTSSVLFRLSIFGFFFDLQIKISSVFAARIAKYPATTWQCKTKSTRQSYLVPNTYGYKWTSQHTCSEPKVLS